MSANNRSLADDPAVVGGPRSNRTARRGRRNGRSLRSRIFGRRLVQLREAAGVRAQDAAREIERDASTVSRVETGEYAIRRTDLRALLSFYGVGEQERQELHELHDQAWLRNWWDEHPAVDGDRTLADLVWLESRMQSLKEFALATVPELLRTHAYAESVLRSADAGLTADRVAAHVDLLEKRRKVLTGAGAPRLSVVIAEPVVHSAARIPEQLNRLSELAGQPGCEIRVLPEGSDVRPGADTSFSVFGMPEPIPAVAQVRTPGGRMFLEGADTEPYDREFDRLRGAAMPPGPSAELLRAAAPR